MLVFYVNLISIFLGDFADANLQGRGIFCWAGGGENMIRPGPTVVP